MTNVRASTFSGFNGTGLRDRPACRLHPRDATSACVNLKSVLRLLSWPTVRLLGIPEARTQKRTRSAGCFAHAELPW